MPSFHEYKRRALLPLAGAAVAIYYFAYYQPLSRKAAGLDQPLEQAWRSLATALDQTNATAVDFRYITNQLSETRRDRELVENTRRQAAARLELSPALRARLSAPFQLVDYQNERNKQIEELDKQSRQQQVAIDPTVLAAFPEHTADLREPSLLWAALAMTDDLLNTALQCKISAIHFLDVALPLTNSPGSDAAGSWAEIPLQMEFTASGENAARLLQCLPLRAEEIRAAGLPPAPPEKSPLLIDRLIVKKQSPDKLDEVRVWLLAVGFVMRE